MIRYRGLVASMTLYSCDAGPGWEMRTGSVVSHGGPFKVRNARGH